MGVRSQIIWISTSKKTYVKLLQIPVLKQKSESHQLVTLSHGVRDRERIGQGISILCGILA
jgi:hypothetical protein